MALDDRERNFEKALGRQLRANAGAGLNCPDAATLAAYHERMLSAEEMVALKSHIAACPHCQETLATLEMTEAIQVGAEDSEKDFAGKTRAAHSAAHVSQPLASSASEAAPAAKRSTVREMRKPKTYMRWVAPAGAIAAGLLIWVVMKESRGPHETAKQASAQVEVADNHELKDTAPRDKIDGKMYDIAPKAAEKTLSAENESSKGAAGLAGSDKEFKSMSRSRVSTNAAPRGPAMMQNQVQNQIQNNGSMNQSDAYEFRMPRPAKPPREASPQLIAPAASAAKSQVASGAPQPPTPTSTPASGSGEGNAASGERKDGQIQAATETVEVTTSDLAVSSDQKKNEIATKEADKSAVNGRMRELSKLESNAAPDATATARKEKQAAEAGRAQLEKPDSGFMAGAMTSASLRDLDEFGLSVVRTADARVFWVISREGEVFRSEDGGKSSRKQELPAGVKAIAGSATDKKIFWILAEKGVAVRTSDGGKHWVSVNVPTRPVLTTIAAQDAMHAVVFDASEKIGYSTADGGATWNLVAQ